MFILNINIDIQYLNFVKIFFFKKKEGNFDHDLRDVNLLELYPCVHWLNRNMCCHFYKANIIHTPRNHL